MPIPKPTPTPIRLGLIGCGYVSKYHLAASAAIGVPIVAACDSKPEAAADVAARTGAKTYRDAEALMTSGTVDAVLIATPHLLHVPLANRALELGLHVLCEKPLAVSAGEADRAIAAHAAQPGLAFAINFNHRAWPLWRSIKSLIDEGALGPIARYQWTITDWYRTQWYFNQSPWRGTWAGEGGGLLVNQCPHELDMIAHLFGAPTRVTARVRFGKHHDISVEDEVHAIFDHGGQPGEACASGASGSFIASTGEPTGANRLEIVGDRGIIRVTTEDEYELTIFAAPASQHTRTSQDRSRPPEFTTRRVVTGHHDDEYTDVLANFVDACAGRAKPLASVADARTSIEIANAILLADDTGHSVTLPVDRAAFAALLERRQQEERRASKEAR
jgi:predicted dehydrogenase